MALQLPASPYKKLNDLLSETQLNENLTPLMLHVGEPQSAVPDCVIPAIIEAQHMFGRYPPPASTVEFNDALTQWVAKRYHVTIDDNFAILPCSGGREALFQIAMASKLKDNNHKKTPTILMPDPMYHVYQGAAKMVGCRAYAYPLHEDNNFTPDLSAIPADILHNTILCYVCNPNNPTGSVMDLAQLAKMADIAEQYDFQIVADECYSEIYRENSAPPASFLELLPKRPELLQRLWIVNSLSKRSGVPGMRIGIIITHREAGSQLQNLRSFSGAHIPPPLLRAATLLLQDEAHVIKARDYYNQLFTLARDCFAEVGVAQAIPAGAMFLWLKVGNGEQFTHDLWQQEHIKLMPGRYMCLDHLDPQQKQVTVGDEYVRIAIVHPADILRPALTKIAQFLHS